MERGGLTSVYCDTIYVQHFEGSLHLSMMIIDMYNNGLMTLVDLIIMNIHARCNAVHVFVLFLPELDSTTGLIFHVYYIYLAYKHAAGESHLFSLSLTRYVATLVKKRPKSKIRSSTALRQGPSISFC